MKEKPILFNTEMVVATLEDRKTQTRRLEGLEELNKNPDAYHLFSETATFNGNFLFCAQRNQGDMYIKCPYGKSGDRLWVREKHQLTKGDMAPTLEEELTKEPKVLYYASDNPRYRDRDKWRPSIHMFKKHARIWLEITDIRVERVQEITIQDIEQEGLHLPWVYFPNNEKGIYADVIGYLTTTFPREDREGRKSFGLRFKNLWDSINGKKGCSWESNPWVWKISFKKITQ